MARRGRGAAVSRPDMAPEGVDGATNGADQPGARTIGAIALQRWVARKTGEPAEGVEEGVTATTRGPYDEADLDPEQTEADKVDFGAVRIPVPRGGQVSVEPEEGRLQAVHVMLPTGRLSVSALAAPRTDRLWPDLAAEIDESLREGGATVRSFTGEWGRELHARTGEASSVFVGVDGPRWMLYGVATGPTSSAEELDAALRRMLRGTVVVRGHLPYPVRTVLPLTVPEHLAEPASTGSRRVPGARGVEPPRRPAAGRPRAGSGAAVPARPRNGVAPAPSASGGPTSGPRRPAPAPNAGEPPTEPYGLPRVAAGPDRNGRPRVNDVPGAVPGHDVHGLAGRPAGAAGGGGSGALGPGGRPHASGGTPAAAHNGAAVRGPDHDPLPLRADRSPAPRAGQDTGGTEQRRVADMAADAERSRPAAQEARPPEADRVHGELRSGAPRPGAAQTGTSWSRYDADMDDIALLRVGGAPRALDSARPAPPATRQTDGADDWTVPMSVVPPEPAPQPDPSRDLWAGDPWAAEARRAAQAARAAEPRAAEPRPAEPRAARNGASAEPRAARNGAPTGPRAARNGAPTEPRYDERQERTSRQRPAHQRPAHHRPAHERPGVDDLGFEHPGVEHPGVEHHHVVHHRVEHRGVEHAGLEGPGRRSAVDVPAARVPPPVRPALAYFAEEGIDPLDGPSSGRHRRPER